MKMMTNKFYLRNTVLLISSIFLSSQLLTFTHADAANNNYFVITTPTSIKLTGKCVKFSVNYKIMPNYREFPAVIRIGLSKSANFSEIIEGEKFAFNTLYYNIDLSDYTWVNQNVDFLGEVNLEFCPQDGQSETGLSIIGLTKPGNYYVFAYANFNTTGERPTSFDTSWLTTSIKITGNSTITCKKGNITKKVTSSNPKCPAGFKKVG